MNNALLLTYARPIVLANPSFGEGMTFADLLTTLGYGLGLWWGVGGPTYAGLASIALDELDGRWARATGTTTQHGSSLDWGSDMALTPLALARLSRELGAGNVGLVAAPPMLLAQSMMRGDGWRPPIGSARAVVMLTAMGVRAYKLRGA